MGADAVFRKLVTCALVASLALNQVSCASLAGESTVGGGGASSSASSSKLVTPTLGSLYRSTRDEYGRYGREQRCTSCSGGGYADRDMRSYDRPGGIYGYYSGRGSVHDDRNWYYRPEGYDDRASYRGSEGQYMMRPGYMGVMMGYDDRYMNPLHDRYYPTSMRGYYDNRGAAAAPVGGDHRMGGGGGGYYQQHMGGGSMQMGGYGYRGNGYDNLDPLYEQYMMASRGGGSRGSSGSSYNQDRYYGGGTSAGYGGGYDDRYRGGYGYDHKNFRPWDETYSGTAGFDNSGRGYYFASRPPSSPSSSAPGAAQHHQQYPSSPSSPSSHYPQQQPPQHHQQVQGQVQVSSHGGAGGPTGQGGTYTSQPIGFHHSSGPDRPDAGAKRPCCPECCSHASNRYPERPAGPTGTGPGYNQPEMSHHQQGGDRPDHGRPGAWNYLSGSGSSSAGGQDYHQASSAAGGSSHAQQSGQDYGNRGSTGYHRPEGGDRQQNSAYGSRPRPSGLGATSYLMDRETGDSVVQPGGTTSELHSADADINANGGSSPSNNDDDNNSNNSAASALVGHDGKPLGESPLKNNDS